MAATFEDPPFPADSSLEPAAEPNDAPLVGNPILSRTRPARSGGASRTALFLGVPICLAVIAAGAIYALSQGAQQSQLTTASTVPPPATPTQAAAGVGPAVTTAPPAAPAVAPAPAPVAVAANTAPEPARVVRAERHRETTPRERARSVDEGAAEASAVAPATASPTIAAPPPAANAPPAPPQPPAAAPAETAPPVLTPPPAAPSP